MGEVPRIPKIPLTHFWPNAGKRCFDKLVLIWVLGFSLEGSEILLHSGLTNLLLLAASLNKAGPLWQHTCLFSSHSTHTSRAWHSCQGVCRKISPYNYSPPSLAFSILSCFYLYMMRLLKFGDFKVQSKTRPIKNPLFSDTSRGIKI